jgi:hypothetical protein
MEQVVVSGFEGDFVAFKAPSGTWGVNLDAFLVSLNAGFGFNQSPHKFTLQFVPTAFNGASGELPPIGIYTTYEVRPGACDVGFFLAGNVTHADYANSANGTTVRIEIQDRRLDVLDEVKITTEDLGGNVPSGVVSVAEVYRRTIGFLDASGNVSDSRVKEYRNITDLGATYQQIHEALIFSSGLGITNFDTDKIPSPAQIAQNLLGSTEPLRWKFTASPLSQVISTVCSDASYDWYWGMHDDKVKLVNRKVTFDVDEDSLAIQTLSPDSVDFRFGKDEVRSPSKVTLFGAHREGFLNSRLLSPLDGIDEPQENMIFSPGWTGVTVSFYDAFGIYREYKPTEKELQMALASIEHWSYYKKFQDTVYGDGSDAGVVAAQHPFFQSRMDPAMPLVEFYNNAASGLRQIANRIDQEHNWVLEWYARISNHANTHYGKTYVLEGFAFNANSGEFKILPAAWCNLENQRQNPTEPFGENYLVDNLYAAVTPFIQEDFKIRGHAVLPSSTVYGPEGFDPPASFTDWNEDAGASGDKTFEHYVPVTLKRVGQKIINPRSEGNAFEDFPEGTIIAQFPILIASGRTQDAILADLVTLHELGVLAANSGLQEIRDPTILVLAQSGISGVAMPVQIRERYGQVWPALWTSGTGSGTRDKLVIDDKFAPWQYFPIGQKPSVDVMSERVSGLIEAELIGVSESRFADISKVDWPFVGFDNYANQSLISGIYGRRDHGVTDITVTYQDGVAKTNYGIKSFFADFAKEAPLGERNAAVLDSIIHPIDFMELNNTSERGPSDIRPIGDGSPVPTTIPPEGIRKEIYAVEITSITNRGSADEPERYFSKTKSGTPKPGGIIDPLDQFDLICRDGFFNVGDHGLYIVEYKENNQRRRYYTQGTDLTTGGFVAEVTSKDVGARTVDITYRGFAITDMEVMNGSDVDAINAGEKGTIVTDGTQHAENDNNITGVRPERPAPEGVFFLPVNSGVSAAAAGSGLPVIIQTISNPGESGALATVQVAIPSGANNEPVGSGATTGNVQPLPHAAFAQSGDAGVFLDNGVGDQFIFIARQGFNSFGAGI